MPDRSAVGPGGVSPSPARALDAQRLRRRPRAAKSLMSEDGTGLGAFPVDGATATDWEDMASVPDETGRATSCTSATSATTTPSGRNVTVYRVAEPGAAPVAPGAALAGVEALQLDPPGGPSDAEALLVDPVTGDLVVVTKSLLGASQVLEGRRRVARARSAHPDGGRWRPACAPAADPRRWAARHHGHRRRRVAGRLAHRPPHGTALSSSSSVPAASRSARRCRASPASDRRRRSRKARPSCSR